MNIFVGVLVFMAIIYLAPVQLVLGITDEMRQRVEKHILEENKANFSGWNGILFYCPYSKDSSKTQKDICEKADVNAEFLAAAAKLNLNKTHSPFEVGILAELEKRLILEVDVYSTSQGSPAVVSARVVAYIDYSYAIENSPWEIKKDDLKMLPRSGKLVVWEEAVIGASSGTSQDLVTPISQGIEQHLKKFFADYLKAQR